VKDGLKSNEIIQFCWADNKERELKAIVEALKEFKLRIGVIITQDEEREKTFDKMKIKMIPLWKWLLGIY
jgi:hypothetical protein